MITEIILFAILMRTLLKACRKKKEKKSHALALCVILALASFAIQFGGTGTEREITAYTLCVYGSGLMLLLSIAQGLNPFRG